MRILIIGASAGIGLEAVKLALERGHEVTALARNTTSIPDHALLTKISGDATVATDLKIALKAADSVLITVGTKHKKGTKLFTDTASALLKATDGVKFNAPVLVVTGFGAGDSKDYLTFFTRIIIRLFLKDQYENKSQMEIMMAQSPLIWEFVRPGMLTNDRLTASYKVLTELFKGMKINKISRADVADYLVKETEQPANLGKSVSLTT